MGSNRSTNTNTQLAYAVVLASIGIACYSVYIGQDILQASQPAVLWSKTQLDGVLHLFRVAKPAGIVETFEPAACQLHGTVVDCACSYGAVEHVNRDVLWPTLEELVNTPFFRYFKVNLYCGCPLWPDEGQCMMRDCCVDACEEDEIPAPWREDEKRRKEAYAQQCGQGEVEGGLDRNVDGMEEKLQAVPDWHGLNNPWVPQDAAQDVEYEYINLKANPEKYTGYKGEDARRIWAAIYDQSCFANIHAEDTCKETQVFYRLISGMHSSITTHIIDNFYDETSGTWGPNLSMFKWRFGNPAARPYVENLYFSYLFVLRAVVKLAPVLENFDYNTGLPADDARTKQLITRLVSNKALRTACPTPFDEGVLWKSHDTQELKAQLRTHFHNITRIMDCVGCDKCKMWGKLQILGIATSLKVLFEEAHPTDVTFDRNEVIALINLLGRLSESVETIRRLSLQLQQEQQTAAVAPAAASPAADSQQPGTEAAATEQTFGAIKELTTERSDELLSTQSAPAQEVVMEGPGAVLTAQSAEAAAKQ